MNRTYETLRGLYRQLPAGLRKLAVFRRLSLTFNKNLPGQLDRLYSEDFFLCDNAAGAEASASAIARSIVDEWKPERVVDVGCGTGVLLERIREFGACSVLGLEAAEAGLKICRSRGITAQSFNITNDSVDNSMHADLVVSLEVAEHLPGECADRFVAVLTEIAPVAVFSAAVPGQGGIGHLNEQPHEYWIEKFQVSGYELKETVTARLREQWRSSDVCPWYSANLMIFERSVQQADETETH